MAFAGQRPVMSKVTTRVQCLTVECSQRTHHVDLKPEQPHHPPQKKKLISPNSPFPLSSFISLLLSHRRLVLLSCIFLPSVIPLRAAGRLCRMAAFKGRGLVGWSRIAFGVPQVLWLLSAF